MKNWTVRSWAASRTRTAALAVVVAASALTVLPTASASAEIRCDSPTERVAPAAVNVDAKRLSAALNYGAQTGAALVRVYRHGCLVGERSIVGDQALPVFSASKSIATLVVGRAVTLGHFKVSDKLGTFFPRADAMHRNLTVEQVLTQTTGIQYSVVPDALGSVTGGVRAALDTPVTATPGTKFNYAQSPLALLPEIIRRTAGADFADFAQRQLFSKIGIKQTDWSWRRDATGTPMIAGGMSIRPSALARFGTLLQGEGTYRGVRLLDPTFLADAVRGTRANPGYGYTFWTNHGDRHVNTSGKFVKGRVWTGSPRDTYAMSGAFGQFLVVMPKSGITIVRMGIPTDASAIAEPASILAGSSNPQFKELFRRVAASAK